MNAPRLYDAWLFKSEEWQRRPLGLHPDAESALAEAKENHPDVVSVEIAGDCGCDYELVEDGSVQRKRWFHEPECDNG